jgi:hypothetical protein
MTKEPLWTKIVGVVAVLPALYIWLWILGPKSWLASYPGKPFTVLAANLCGIPLSLVAAIRGSRIWYLVTAIAIATYFFIGFRLH